MVLMFMFTFLTEHNLWYCENASEALFLERKGAGVILAEHTELRESGVMKPCSGVDSTCVA